jgi:hypothetical protein
MINTKYILTALIAAITITLSGFSQISPGELSKVHSHLEGMGKCTQCHTLGSKVSNDKCLACHTEIKERIIAQKGYHSSPTVKGKECASCHNDHHGRNFQIIRFDRTKFQHQITGFNLEGAHGTLKCEDCHKPANIQNQKLKAKASTYLGLKTECLSCHADYHQKTLPSNCLNCHGMESFKPAVKFSHASAKFPLNGKHQQVECSKCHPIEVKAGVKFQNFKGIAFTNCTNCHTDVHQNKYGQNCRQCHTEASFHVIKNMQNFDHSRTGFKLEGKHGTVSCVSCHKTNYSSRPKHDKCTDCHSDYHGGQFISSGMVPDCSKCHTVNGFTPSNYTITQHNQCGFKLNGAHVAVACFECHRKEEKWNFRKIGKVCADCHPDIHQPHISIKYYPDKNCLKCHTENKWTDVSFDHSQTNFKLTGVHTSTACRTCHFVKNTKGQYEQRFSGLSTNCMNCHKDNHNKQFEKNGTTDCNECHGTTNWAASKFDHNRTAFKLDGKHRNVACSKCHKPGEENKYVLYKIKNFKCESCHLQ